MAAQAGAKTAYQAAIEAAKSESAPLTRPLTGQPPGLVVVDE